MQAKSSDGAASARSATESDDSDDEPIVKKLKVSCITISQRTLYFD